MKIRKNPHIILMLLFLLIKNASNQNKLCSFGSITPSSFIIFFLPNEIVNDGERKEGHKSELTSI